MAYSVFEKIKNQAALLHNDIISFLGRLIEAKSLSAEEENCAGIILNEMRKLGYDEAFLDPMGNVIGRIGKGRHIVAFDGHIDTVDGGNISLWNTDPFKAVIQDDKIFGRGAVDQKGGVASMIYAGKIIKDLGIDDIFTVYITGTVQEEDCDGLCWQYIFNEDKIKPEFVIITEPTGLKLNRGQRGRMEIEISTVGISAHGSMPERGQNAIYRMSPVIADIEKLNDRLLNDDFLGKGSVAISQIRSTSPSLCAVADGCTIHLDRRLTGGETEETALHELYALSSVRNSKAEIKVLEYDRAGYKGLSYPSRKYYPSWVCPAESRLVQSGASAYRNLYGKNPEISRWIFSTNGVATMGMFSIPTIGFGPGDEIHAHSPNEFCPVGDLKTAAEFYAALLAEYKIRLGA
jgi:putative selenium metabolism hydrolase